VSVCSRVGSTPSLSVNGAVLLTQPTSARIGRSPWAVNPRQPINGSRVSSAYRHWDCGWPACVIHSRYPFKSSSNCCFSRSFLKSPRALAFSRSFENSLSFAHTHTHTSVTDTSVTDRSNVGEWKVVIWSRFVVAVLTHILYTLFVAFVSYV